MGIGLTECVRLEVESGGGMTLFSLSCSFFCFLLPLLWAEGQSEPALAAEAPVGESNLGTRRGVEVIKSLVLHG